MDVRAELRELGFTPNDIAIYIGLLRTGATKAGALAKEVQLERTSVYGALQRLRREGLVSIVREGSRQVFSAAPPQAIVDAFREKQERAALLVPALSALQRVESRTSRVQTFRGYAGVKAVLGDVLASCASGDEYLIFGSEAQLSTRMPTFAKIFVARKDKKRLRARILIRDDALGMAQSAYTAVRYVSSQFMSQAVTTVYADKMSIILWNDVPEAIVIEDAGAARSYRSYFELLWEQAKTTRNQSRVPALRTMKKRKNGATARI